MSNLQTIYNNIGDKRLEALWNVADDENNYDEAEWYIESNKAVDAALSEIKNKALINEIDESINAYISCAMYQSFVIGFKEAIKLLNCGNDCHPEPLHKQ